MFKHGISRRGFTLVELSIVLVIIGLLIGGVLVGQSLIESAKINSFVSQMQQYSIAVSSFKQRYRSLPGDARNFPLHGYSTLSTLGNGRVTLDPHVRVWAGMPYEAGIFWAQLSDAGMLDKKYSAAGNLQYEAGVNAPKVAIGLKGTTIVGATTCRMYDFGYCDIVDHYFTVCYQSNGVSNAGCASSNPAHFNSVESAIAPLVALAADKKMDDGMPGTGDVVATSRTPDWTVGHYGFARTDCTNLSIATNPTTAVYRKESLYQRPLCGLKIKMFSAVGGNQ